MGCVNSKQPDNNDSANNNNNANTNNNTTNAATNSRNINVEAVEEDDNALPMLHTVMKDVYLTSWLVSFHFFFSRGRIWLDYSHFLYRTSSLCMAFTIQKF